MAILVDTNVLLRCIEPSDRLNTQALAALKILGQQADVLGVVPQNIVEFWTAATRPRANNGLGLTPENAKAEVEVILNTFRLFPENAEVFEQWRKLVETFAVSGRDTHDARIVAAMNVHSILSLLTFDEEDFRRYANSITVLTPRAVVARHAGATST